MLTKRIALSEMRSQGNTSTGGKGGYHFCEHRPLEQSEYPVTQLWSDIGGAAGMNSYHENEIILYFI